jgi:asparagine synthase (glutamine-hydrolysing)
VCGIAGFVGAGSRDILSEMARRLVHRGPDSQGLFIDPGHAVHFAHRRLSILDIEGGHQPMLTNDGRLAIVFNGEIYNFRELRQELEASGAVFRSDHSDTETLLLAWDQWRANMFSRLNGMWSFALFDRDRRELILARDRFGKKPLFYWSSGQGFVFASELTAMRAHPSVPSRLCERALRKYFAYGFVPAPLSFVEGVNKLPGGHWMRVSLDTMKVETHRFWEYRPEPFSDRPAGIEQRWTDELRHLLTAAVRRRMVADVPIGSFLSGGVDSSTVSALAIKHVGKDRLKTFSIGFEEASFDETAYAMRVAQYIGADHYVERLSADKALEILPDIQARLDEPIADSSILPTYLLCQHARRLVTVAIGGDGADELFAGYDPFKALRYARWYERLVPRPLHRAVSLVAARLPVSHRYMSFDFRLKRTLRGLNYRPNLWLPIWMAPLAPSEMESLCRDSLKVEDLFSEAIDIWDNCDSADPVDRTIAYYIRLYLQDDILVKVDRASMLHSLEVRAPFLDIDVVDFARRLPANTKVRGATTKWILKQLAKELLPAEVVSRPKQGFGVPIGQWFQDGRLRNPPLTQGYNASFFQARLSEHVARATDQRAYLWSDWILRTSHLYAASRDA